ncbi:uncharacterized protein LOC111358147 [Spodoptera litura]|uniref:Uncharacterized protein LOC111358147 n=1 Tax=Spodoptera litura TaxID=69820 RepID=A0A9J7ED50_SPOLT|nr:uncharacterized protein LOC111358147 [Spodoptera litura]
MRYFLLGFLIFKLQTTVAQYPSHTDLQKVGEVIFNNEKFNVLKPTVHVITDYFKDFMLRRENDKFPTKRVFIDHNGFRHAWSGFGNKVQSLRKTDLKNVVLNSQNFTDNLSTKKAPINDNTTVVAKTTTEVAKTTTEVAKTTTKVAKTTTEAAKTTTEVAKTTTKIAGSTTEVAKTTTEVAKTTTKIAESTTEVAKTTTKIAESTTEVAETTTAVTKTTTEVAETTTEVASTKIPVATTEAVKANTESTDNTTDADTPTTEVIESAVINSDNITSKETLKEVHDEDNTTESATQVPNSAETTTFKFLFKASIENNNNTTVTKNQSVQVKPLKGEIKERTVAKTTFFCPFLGIISMSAFID